MLGGELIPDVRFADDQGMISNSEGGLQRLMDRLNEVRKSYKIKINVKKTNTMVVSRTEGKTVNILIEWQKVEQVKKFKYLGAVISEDGRCIDDVKQRVAMGKEAFNKRRELMTGGMGREVKKRLVKALVWPVALCGCETWTLRNMEIDRLRAFEIWIWRRMERISWIDKKKIEEVLTAIGEERSLVEAVVKRKKNWIGHIVRGEGLLKLALEGRMEEKRQRGRPRLGMIDDLKEGFYESMKRRAEDRDLGREFGCQGPAVRQRTHDDDET